MNDKKYFSTIEVLRGMACMMVVVYHFSMQESYYGFYLSDKNFLRQIGQYGWLGVQVFFVISGFVIPFSMDQAHYKRRNAGLFLLKRWWRLWPAYFISLFLVLANTAFQSWVWEKEFSVDWINFGLHLFYLPSFFGYEWYNVLYWTLGMEIQFYILMALLFPLFVHPAKAIRILTLVIFSFVFMIFPANTFVTSQSSLFVFGILAFWIYTGRLKKEEFLIVLFLNCLFVFRQFGHGALPIGFIALITTLMICYVKLDFKLGKELGKISYSLYLIHGLVAVNLLILSMSIGYVKEHEWVRILIVLISIAIAVGVAYIYWYLIERPSHQRSRKITYR